MTDPWPSLIQPADQVRTLWTPRARTRGPLTEDDVREIRSALAKPYHVPACEIADHYGISLSMVSAIKLRRVWKHVDVVVTSAWTHERPTKAELRLGSMDQRRGQKARTRAAQLAWRMA